MRRLLVRLLGGLAAAAMLAGCASQVPDSRPESSVTTVSASSTAMSADRSTPETAADVADASSEPVDAAPAIPVVDAPTVLQPLEQDGSARFSDLAAVGREYAVVTGREVFPALGESGAIYEAVIKRLSDGAVVARYAPSDRGREIGNAYFSGGYVVLVVPVVNEGVGPVSEAAWAIRLDFTTGEAVNLTDSLDEGARGESDGMAVVGGNLVAVGPNTTSDGEAVPQVCFTAITIATAVTRPLGCAPEGMLVSNVTPTDRGVSYLASPRVGDDGCQRRIVIDLTTGEHTGLTDDGLCRTWDGLTDDGWRVWTTATAADFADGNMRRSTLYAQAADGTAYTLGDALPLSAFRCGSDVYFLKTPESASVGDTSDAASTSLIRWQPGAPSAERVFSIDGSQRHIRFPTCTDDVATVGYWDDDAPTVPHTSYFPAGS